MILECDNMPSSESRARTQLEQQFFRALRDLHREAGEPSSRAMATKIGGMSHTTVNAALRGPRVPTWPVVVKVVEALGGDIESIRPLWLRTQEPLEIVTLDNESEIEVFVSYARIDDRATYERISKLIVSIADTYQSMTGRAVGVFKDVDTIRPGEDWRDRIRAGLSYSSIFLAFITPAYLRSPNCREELNEFLSFLTASSAERLVIPLIYTKRERIETSFADDELWKKIGRLHGPDISGLRYVEPGSPEWIRTTEELADRIDQTLSSFKHAEPKEQADRTAKMPSNASTAGSLERMVAIEEKVPHVVSDMERITQLLYEFNVAVEESTPQVSSASSFSERLALSRALAKQLDPIAEEMASTTERLVSNFSEWDYFVQYILEYTRRGGDLEDPQAKVTLGSLWTMAKMGSTSLFVIKEFAQTISQVIGVSSDLDRPLTAVRDASLRIADLSGLLDGWKKSLEDLESEHLGTGYLDSLPSITELTS
jgi:hypothetical protein